MTSINAIKQKIIELGALIDAPIRELILLEKPSGDGTPYIEIINDEYHYVSSERGMEISRRITNEVDELLYWIFKRAASAMASTYEFQNRIENIDSRRINFAKQIEIMEKLNGTWANLMKDEIEKILQSAPYDDLS